MFQSDLKFLWKKCTPTMLYFDDLISGQSSRKPELGIRHR